MNPHSRVREKQDSKVLPWKFHYYHPAGGPGDDKDYFRQGGTFWTQRSVIVDVVGDDRRYKPVHHRHLRHHSQVSGGSWNISNGGTLSIRDDRCPLPQTEYWPAGFQCPHVSDGRVALAVDAAFIAMSEQLPTEVNILNFGWELRELGDLIPSLAEGLSRTVSGQYLNWQFGVKPLVADIKKLGSVLKTVESRLAYLRQTYGKRVRVGHQQKIDVDLPTATATFSSLPDDPTGYRTVLTPIKSECLFQATGYIFHRLEGLYGVEATIRGAISALGLLSPTEALWNAIPFSFVADWFGRLGNVLSRLDTIQPFPGEWHCIDFGYSLTESAEYRVDFEVNTTSGYQRRGGGVVQERLYRRFVGLPVDPTQIIGSGTLTTSQQLLSMALLNSGRKH